MSTSRRKPVTRRSPLVGLRFRLENLILRGLSFRLLMAVAIVVGIAVLAGVAVTVLDGSVDDPAEGIWWAFLRLTDPGYLGDDEGVARRAISTIVTVLGYLLFLGLLIAILTQWLNQTIAKLESGVTPIALSDHVLILGWTNQTRAIAESSLTDLNWQTNSGAYYRGPGVAPHNLYSSTQRLWGLTPFGHPGAPDQQYQYLRPGTQFKGSDATHVDVQMQGIAVDWDWNEERGQYERSQSGGAHNDTTFGRIGATNVVVMGVLAVSGRIS